MNHECYACHTKTVKNLIEKFKPEESVAEDFKCTAEKILSENEDQSNPHVATLIHRIASSFIENENLYAEEKNYANELFLGQYDMLKKLVRQSSDPLYMAAKLAVAGNIIDYGAHSVSGDIEKQIHSILKQDFAHDDRTKLFKRIKEASSILYLGDNAGEIVFDKLFIETIQHPNVTFVVRGRPVINDVTTIDAEKCGMHQVCNVISNGYDAPSTILEHCSNEFLEAYLQADLVISKGQGNFEGLMNSRRENLFFMLMAKCNLVADMLGVQKGDLVVKELD